MNRLPTEGLEHFREVINEPEARRQRAISLFSKDFRKTYRLSILEMITDGPSLNQLASQ